MDYVKSAKNASYKGGSRIIAATKELGELNIEDDETFLTYFVRMGVETDFDIALKGYHAMFYIVFSEDAYIIKAGCLDYAKERVPRGAIVIGELEDYKTALRFKRRLLKEMEGGLERTREALQERLETLILSEK